MEQAQVAKLVDAPVSGTGDASHGGSSPLLGTNTDEALIITAEECAEVIQQISKIMRFGIDLPHVRSYEAGNGKSNRQKLAEEIGDLRCMISILMERKIVDDVEVYMAEAAKRKKLRKWSNLFND